MTVKNQVDIRKFPKQGDSLHHRVEVYFDHDADPPETILGEIVRHDVREPFTTIIALDDGRFLNGGECLFFDLGPRKRCWCFAECICKMRSTGKPYFERKEDA